MQVPTFLNIIDISFKIQVAGTHFSNQKWCKFQYSGWGYPLFLPEMTLMSRFRIWVHTFYTRNDINFKIQVVGTHFSNHKWHKFQYSGCGYPNESIVNSVEALWITPINNSPFLLSTNKKLPLRSRDLKCIHTVYYTLIGSNHICCLKITVACNLAKSLLILFSVT